MEEISQRKGLLSWFAANHVAANLLMCLVIAAGLLSILTIKVEFFPEFTLDMITVTVPYLGASPADVEEGVILRVEEGVAAVDGIKRLTATAAEGAGTVMIEVEEYADAKEVLDDVKAEVDRIITFPEETEKPIITEINTRYEVITIVIYGNVPEKTLKQFADRVRDDLTAMDNISQVDVTGVRPYEISIEVSEKNLRRYGLTFDRVADAVRNSSLDIPAGSVKTAGGEILVRTEGQMYYGPEFENVIVFARDDGTDVRLRDIAAVRDDFADTDLYARFDGKPAALVKVYRVGDQGALDVADTVNRYVEQRKDFLPAGVSMATWEDTSVWLRARIDLLRRNGYLGLILVFLCLTLFLNVRLAFWTTMGIPISFLGAFWLLPRFDVSLNMISLFAFIMSLGLVVDDAIVVGENIFACRRQGMTRIQAAIKGVREMAAPVTLAVLTTVFAFMPLLFLIGIMGKIMRVIPIVVISVLMVSLAEALLILPAHLSGGSFFWKLRLFWLIDKIQTATERRLERFVNGSFARFVAAAVRRRYVTVAAALAIFAITLGWIVGGYIKIVFFDPVEADNMVATLAMPMGTPVRQTRQVVARIERAAEQLRKEVDANRPGKPSIIKHVATTIGDQPQSRGGHGPVRGVGAVSDSHLAEVNIELLGAEGREDISSADLKNRWRQLVGEIPGVSSLTFFAEIMSTGEPINVELSHQNFDTLLNAVEKLKSFLREFSGVSDIADSFEEGKAELKLRLKDTGRTLGLTLFDLARQVRQGFYGEEAQRIQRGRDDIRVMVRYPEQERKSLADIENMRIRLPVGTEVPFKEVAHVDYGRGYAAIQRADRRRVVNVTADVDETVANAREINMDLATRVLPRLMQAYPGLKYRFAGEERERNESFSSLLVTFPLAMLAIYALLAVQFRSYLQPLIVMSAIPFGIVGAIIGHILMGFVFMTKFNLSLLSMLGIVALSGVVVNDSLILIDLINRERKEGVGLPHIIRDCATRRFRPIMLTTLTTFFGLAPMMLERSLQARFLIPMAISLAFGVMFATLITLFLVPSLYMILEDIKGRIRITPLE
ncbi:MAG TPA: efflux RND transporter permease subunit [Sedimentisphaerales bacterium]|nr:efflux RND transporter permease subunit [Sedimentisphaerales bacterium]